MLSKWWHTLLSLGIFHALIGIEDVSIQIFTLEEMLKFSSICIKNISAKSKKNYRVKLV